MFPVVSFQVKNSEFSYFCEQKTYKETFVGGMEANVEPNSQNLQIFVT